MLVLKPSEHSHILARKRDLLGLDRGFCLLVVVYLERTRFLSDNQPRKLEISELCTRRQEHTRAQTALAANARQ
jgi:hypothetical protein